MDICVLTFYMRSPLLVLPSTCPPSLLSDRPHSVAGGGGSASLRYSIWETLNVVTNILENTYIVVANNEWKCIDCW